MAVHNAGIHILCFATGGQVQLEENGEIIWSSDDDEDFREEITDEFLDAEKDQERVLEYLVDAEILTQEQAENIEIESESLEADEDQDDDADEET
jgi:ABC-type phosphate/phosphonate transport system substrate-binding protein